MNKKCINIELFSSGEIKEQDAGVLSFAGENNALAIKAVYPPEFANCIKEVDFLTAEGRIYTYYQIMPEDTEEEDAKAGMDESEPEQGSNEQKIEKRIISNGRNASFELGQELLKKGVLVITFKAKEGVMIAKWKPYKMIVGDVPNINYAFEHYPETWEAELKLLKTLGGQVQKMDEDINSVMKDASTLDSRIGSTESSVYKIENDITSLKGSLSSCKSDVDYMKNMVSILADAQRFIFEKLKNFDSNFADYLKLLNCKLGNCQCSYGYYCSYANNNGNTYSAYGANGAYSGFWGVIGDI